MKKTFARIIGIIGIVMIVAVIFLTLPIVLPNMIGYKVFTVVSGSMEPTIPTGSLIYVKGIEPDTIKAEDVIAFYGIGENSGVVTHRVVSNNVSEKSIVTKGDANEKHDVNPVDYNRVIGIVVNHMPLIGYWAKLFLTPVGKLIAIFIIALGFIFKVVLCDRYVTKL